MIITEYHLKDIEEFNTLLFRVQKKLNRTVVKKYQGSLKDLYSLIAPSFLTYGLFEKQSLLASASFLRIDNRENIFFITDLLKKPELLSLVGLKLVLFFLEAQSLWKHNFCLTFVEEDLNALESLLSRATKKFGLLKREELIYSNIFYVRENIETAVDSSMKEKIEGVECTFFTDKKVRTFMMGDKTFKRAYVSVSTNVPANLLPCIIETGKNYAYKAGCNVFVLLTADKSDLQQDYVYTNRKIELWNKTAGEPVDLISRGILI